MWMLEDLELACCRMKIPASDFGPLFFDYSMQARGRHERESACFHSDHGFI